MAFNTRADRAKIFAPFDALKGLHETLASQEEFHVSKIALSDEAMEEIDFILRNLCPGQTITVTFYSLAAMAYLNITGNVTHISGSSQMLMIENTRISFDDIKEIIYVN